MSSHSFNEHDREQFCDNGNGSGSDVFYADIDEHGHIGKHAARFGATVSFICPETGRVTTHDVRDLRSELDEFQESVPRRKPEPTPTFRSVPVVAVDDELHDRDGERLGVLSVTPDGRVFTLRCYESGTVLRRTAVSLKDDIGCGRLRVYRSGMPDVHPEHEEGPCVFVDEDGWFYTDPSA